MQKASIAGSIFIGIFGIPFFALGLLFASKMADAARQGSDKGAYLGIAFGTLFACIGLGLMALAIGTYRYGKKQQALVTAHPGAPWLWRSDWAAGRSKGNSGTGNIALWVFAIFWDAISFPAAALTLPKLMAGDLRLIFVMIFPVVGIILTVVAVIGTMRAQRFGGTSFWFATVPFTPGGKVDGFIHLKMPIAAVHGIDVRLSCIRRVTTGSGKSRSTINTVLWQDERNVSNEHLTRAYADAQVPVEFTIPTDAYVTNTDNADDKILWILHAQADVPGVDFKDDYEVPVFRTQRAASMVVPTASWVDGGAQNREAAAAAPALKLADEPVIAPEKTHIVITEEGAGIKVYFPPLRNPGQALGLFAFTIVWTGVVYLLFNHPAPWIFRILFGAAEVLIGLALINVVFGSSAIRVGEGTLQVRKALMGIATTQTVALDAVQSITPVSMGQADASGATKFGIFVQLADSRVFRVAANSLSRREARWIVAALDRALGRRADPQPQFKPLIIPLPGASRAGIVRVGGVSITTIARWIGALFFAGWLFFIARMVFHFVGR